MYPLSENIYSSEQSITDLFETEFEKYGDHLAINTRNKKLSYQELNQRANQIGRFILTNLQTDIDRPIAIFIEQGINSISSLLGVLKTGSPYTPIDPSFPAERNAYILNDSQATIVLTDSKNYEAAKQIAESHHQIINIDDILKLKLNSDNLNIAIAPDDLAYIVYTSGSTGKPKGVVQNHRNVLHNAINQATLMSIDCNDRLTLFHSSSVMGGNRNLYNALLMGATLYPFDILQEGLDIVPQWLIDNRVTVYHAVATLFRSFVDILPRQENFPDLRLIILGGEAVIKKDIERYKTYFSSKCQLFTGLGTTETGTVTYSLINKNTEIQDKVPLGYEVNGMKVLLLDENGEEVKENEIGEISVKSKYVALGYWQKSELTEQVFVKSETEENVRIYRTGDLGRRLSNGCLFHCGRKDFQVKIRGNRVEVAEVEKALLDSGLIKQVVVMGHSIRESEQILVAYLIPLVDGKLQEDSLRNYLRSRLPVYMIPSIFVEMDSFPLTPNGKIDRKSLPIPDILGHSRANYLENTLAQKKYEPPHTPTEETLVQIWEELLEMKNIGITDNFFSLGGHSLIAVRMLYKIQQNFGVDLFLPDLFQHSTIEKLAIIITQKQVYNLDQKQIEDFLVALETK